MTESSHFHDPADNAERDTHPAIVAALAGARNVTKRVAVKLIGGLRRARVAVEGQDIELRAITGGAGGSAEVILVPNHIDVAVDLTTGPFVTVTVTLTIDARSVSRPVRVRGGRVATTLQFDFAEFGLPTVVA